MKIVSLSILSFLSIVSFSVGFSPQSCTSGRHENGIASIPTACTIPSLATLKSMYKSGKNTICLRMAEDDEDEENDPLSKGVDSVSWLPSLKEQPKMSSETPEDAEVLPFFPLGGIVYTPNSEHVLNIFEPRYRQMYNDILMNGSKRFVVSMSHPTKEATFAEVGVIFYLDDLKEVSEQTNDQIKYICNHSVTGRVKLHRVLNPEVWSTRETYLKVEGTILNEDEDDDETEEKTDEPTTDIYTSIMQSQRGSAEGERTLQNTFKGLVQRQHELEEDVRFTRASVTNLAVSKGDGENGLWMTVRLWQSFIEQRLVARQNEMQKDFQEKLIKFLKKEKGVKNDNELPSAIGFEDLSPSLQKEVTELQIAMTKELKPLILESTLTIQKLLEAQGHEDRLSLLNYFMNAEKKRLDAKKTLQGMFTGLSTAVTTESTPDDFNTGETIESRENEPKVQDDQNGSSPNSIILDDEDAFQ